jgi:hypothetical protein
MFSISCKTAPVGEVTSAIRRGNFGSDLFRSLSKRPSAKSFLFNASNFA